MEQRAIYRILDAAANRAAEGLRTVEEYARFFRDDGPLMAELKSLRHALATATSRVDRHRLLAARDTSGDCGTAVGTDSERSRSGAGDVVAAALARTQQALRCLEEYGKILSVPLAEEAERLRYRLYTLEKRLLLAMHRQARLSDVLLYLLVDCQCELESWLQRLERLATAGVDAIQLRDKTVDDRTLLRYAEAAAARLRTAGATRSCLLIINDRADIATAVDADGVHVGQEELTVEAARRVLGEDKLVGVSTHSVAQLRAAMADGADYVGCGPSFPSRTKAFEAFAGPEFLRAAAAESSVPAYAIGGIDAGRLPEVLASGIDRVAVSGAIWGQADEVAACRELSRLLRERPAC
jgi:thiamine-phosphate pyrophosphorylase